VNSLLQHKEKEQREPAVC